MSNLGVSLAAAGRVADGVNAIREAVSAGPDAILHGNLLFTMAFDPLSTADAILTEARKFDVVHARPVAVPRPPRNDRSPDRRLRIGYVSPDFRTHCQSLFTVPLFSHHDHASFEVFLYSGVGSPDAMTRRLAGHADHVRNLFGIDDRAAADRIRDDGIDILVDLTMHMSGGRPLVFARKPAPVQIAWLAYPGTTGLSAIDYRVTDPHLDPPEDGPGPYAEKPLRLRDTFWCYDPLAEGIDVGPLPAFARGHVTFGCLNNFSKTHAGVFELWARVLGEVRGSRLLVRAPAGQARDRLLHTLGRGGVTADRVEFADFLPRERYLETYRTIDVCLDTFPYGGHTTSLDSFWMGVPVVTLVGATVVGRAGLCQAMNLGLPELVARTREEYVQRAVALCSDLEGLSRMREGLRARMEASPLMDAPRFARNMEAAYRSAWRAWCADT
jgi:predicted O-linked N-acetylglucosamine transferase (SPINDLY family)